MKVSCSKTEYICVKEMDPSGTARLQGTDKVEYFKYLVLIVQSTRQYGKEVKMIGTDGEKNQV